MVVEVTKEKLMDTFSFFLECLKNSDSEGNLVRHYRVCNAYISVMYVEHMLEEDEHTKLIQEVSHEFFANKCFRYDLL